MLTLYISFLQVDASTRSQLVEELKRALDASLV